MDQALGFMQRYDLEITFALPVTTAADLVKRCHTFFLSTAFPTQSLCVTASVDACNFRVPIPAGSSVFFDSYVTFTSEKSMEIEVVVHHAQLNPKSESFDTESSLEVHLKLQSFYSSMTK